MSGATQPQPLFKNDGPKLGAIVLRFADRHRYWVFGYLIVMYALGFSTCLRLSPDTAAYLLTGQRLASGLDMAGPAGYGEALSPGFPWLIAGFERVLGGHAQTALLAFMLLAGAAGVVLVYRLFLIVADRPTAVVMALFAGINHVVYSYTLRPMPDLLFYDGVLLALWGWHTLWNTQAEDPALPRAQRWRGGLTLAAGLALMAATRSVVGVVVAAILLECVFRLIAARRWRWLAGCVAAGVGAAVLLHISQAGFTLALTPDEDMLRRRLIEDLPATLRHALTGTGPALLNEYAAEAAFGLSIRGTAAPLSLLVLGAGLALWRAQRLWALIILMFLAQWLLVGATTRYFIPIVPLLGYGWWRMAVGLEKRIGAWPGTLVFIVLLCLLPGGSMLKSGNTMLLQRSRPFYDHYNTGKYAATLQLAEVMRDTLPDDALVVAGENTPAELALLTGLDVRPEVRHLYAHDGPAFIIEPVTPNAQTHIGRGDAVPGETLAEFTDHHGRALRLRRLTPGPDAPATPGH